MNVVQHSLLLRLSSLMQALRVAPNPAIDALRMQPGSIPLLSTSLSCHVMSCHTMHMTATTRLCKRTSRHTCLLIFMPIMFMPSMPEVVTGLALGAKVLGVACCRRAQEGDSGLALRHSRRLPDKSSRQHKRSKQSAKCQIAPLQQAGLAEVVKSQSRFCAAQF